MEKIGNGEMIKLEDGSLWKIDHVDRIDTMLWLITESITVVEDAGGYTLINTDTGDKVGATLEAQ